MKQFGKLLVAAALAFGVSANAQNEDNPWSVTVGANAVDFYSAANENNLNGQGQKPDIFTEFFNVEDNWNMIPSISQLTVGRYVGSGVVVDVTGTFNKISQFGNHSDGTNSLSVRDVNDDTYLGIDLGVNYHFNTLWDGLKWFDPYLRGNGGFNWIGDFNGKVAGGGLGINFWFTENLAIKAQSVYKNNFDEETETPMYSETKYFQHTLGLQIAFGGKDTDGDGIYDKEDACVDTPGIKEFNGCPDTDGDGIQDSKDSCPEVAGLAEFNGCPDTDGDGVADPNDECVDTPGLKELAGCPDADADGIADAKDGCPNEAGPAANNGCPWPDKDGDSVLDKDDQCPDVAGTVANNGCPEPSEEVIKKLNEYAKTILFDSGRASFKEQTYEVLKAMKAIFLEYPQSKFSLEGHTDSVGSAKTNKKLSEKRANAVRDWLVQNGIGADRLTATGFGEDKPIDTNRTRAGRKNNRRVEVKLLK